MSTSRDLFRGKRLRFAAPRPEDVNLIASWTEDSEFSRQMDTDFARPLTPESASKHINTQKDPQSAYFHLRTIPEDILIGFITIHSIEWNNGNGTLAVGIGHPDYRSKGYGVEALKMILHYAFNELNLYRVSLDVIASNERAVRAYQKAGFVEEGRMRGGVLRDGQRIDRIYMGILRDEWNQQEEF